MGTDSARVYRCDCGVWVLHADADDHVCES